MNHLGLFAKFWQPGTVKTRLAASIGDSAACKLYHAFVFHLLEQLADSGDTRGVVFSPPEKESDFRDSVPAVWSLCPQSKGDLGTRMRNFFETQFQMMEEANVNAAVNKIVVIGADCPQLDSKVIENAFTQLDEVPVVLGPSTDGGYYLIAMSGQCRNIFDDIAWSTERVLEQTAQQLTSKDIPFRLLQPLTDVDEIESLQALESELTTRATTNELTSADANLLLQINQASQRVKP